MIRDSQTMIPPTGFTRRRFLTIGATTIVGSAIGARTMRSQTVKIPRTTAAGRSNPEHWMPDQPQSDRLHALALVAMDAARSAGAEAADIRLGVLRHVDVGGFSAGAMVGYSIGYGVRAWSGGTWSFQHGNVLTPDAVAATARSASAGARRYADINVQLARHRRDPASAQTAVARGEWADAPVVTGMWRVPRTIDPFTVPIDDYERIVEALDVIPTPFGVPRYSGAHGHTLRWWGETRVFASMAGSLVTQDFLHGGIDIQAIGTLPPDMSPSVFLHVPEFDDLAAGFETALRPDIQEAMRRKYEEVIRWRELPQRAFSDIGRFPVVLDGRTMAGMVGNTVGNALDGDRVSGLEADASGGSFLVPPDAVLDAAKVQFSPSLTMHVARRLPSPMAAQWDDDGVVPDAYTVLDRGRVVDFYTTRETAPMLAEWNARHGRTTRSHGCAVAPTPTSVPRCSGGHTTVVPASGTISVDDLMRDMTHGFLMINGATDPTPGLTGGAIFVRQDGVMLEVRRGVPVARVRVPLQFTTNLVLGKNLRALGDATTCGTEQVRSAKGIPWQEVSSLITAPAALCTDVDVLP